MANGDDVPGAPDPTPVPPPAEEKKRKAYTITDKKSGESVEIWGPLDNPDLNKLRSMAHDVFMRRRNFNPVDMFESIPRGMVRGFFSAPSMAAELGKAEVDILSQAATGQPSGVPALSAEQMTSQIETAAGYEMHKPQTRGGKAGERIGEFIGDPTSWIGPGGIVRKTLQATLGGIGSEEGERVGRKYGRPGLGAALGAISGGGIGAGFSEGLPGRVPRDIRQATTEDAVKAASKAGYKQLGQFEYKLNEGQNLVLNGAIKRYLIEEEGSVFDDLLAPKTWAILDRWMPRAKTVADVERVRQVLNQARMEGGNEALAASKAIEALDDYMYELPGVGGVAKQARGDWAAYKRGQMIEETIRRGVERANVSGKGGGANIVNTIKQEFKRRIRDKPDVWKRFSADEQHQIDLILDPGRSIDVAHWLSNFAPRNPITGAIALFGAGHVTGDPLSQLAILGTGEVAHRFAKRLTRGRAERLLEATRARSPAGAAAAGLPEGEIYKPPGTVSVPARRGYGALRAGGSSAISPETTDVLELPEITVRPP